MMKYIFVIALSLCSFYQPSYALTKQEGVELLTQIIGNIKKMHNNGKGKSVEDIHQKFHQILSLDELSMIISLPFDQIPQEIKTKIVQHLEKELKQGNHIAELKNTITIIYGFILEQTKEGKNAQEIYDEIVEQLEESPFNIEEIINIQQQCTNILSSVAEETSKSKELKFQEMAFEAEISSGSTAPALIEKYFQEIKPQLQKDPKKFKTLHSEFLRYKKELEKTNLIERLDEKAIDALISESSYKSKLLLEYKALQQSGIDKASELLIKLTAYEKLMLSEQFRNKIRAPQISFESLIGEKKGDIKTFLNKMKNPTAFRIKNDNWNFVFYGEPGCGKTETGEAIAYEIGADVLIIPASDLLSEYVGKSEKIINNLIDLLLEEAKEKNKKQVLVIDEFDSIGRTRGSKGTEHYQGVVNTLLNRLNNLDPRLIIICTTNSLESLDPALTRGGRLDKHVKFEKPSKSEREELLKLLIKKYNVSKEEEQELDLNELSKKTNNYSHADIKLIFEKAVNKKDDPDEKQPLNMASFKRIIKEKEEKDAENERLKELAKKE